MKFGNKNRRKAGGQIRIISGQWRGRKLPVLDHEGLRPTTDRNKETLFNWLAPYLADSRCLDGFAGSGSLGLEALSRHAAQVVFVEKHKAAAMQIQKNCQTLKLSPEQAQVRQTDLLSYLQGKEQPFDLVFLDPPFERNLLPTAIEALDQHQWLSPEALIYVESEQDLNLDWPEHWQLLKQKQAGQVVYRLFQRQVEP
ncbi:16S rRNA (guanine(966)-N(2))-methyltransferase [Saliniradius amylolyticus]|uniref:Ribosomal RNA small subunit methyltransferase D n=1 Tax=Saliniradius amylolyticus TaxID=2183582 RepID=A0A2S2DZN0_9ALTE|nr:16S rRNA (guanine(966)-N(2))-methyltransferase RsmD [Saliniradius amylolyticus]AWL10858.1 16S rRNA (guanine(966)-N(2))-methyltransferase [Saliniradius amylolyticus]